MNNTHHRQTESHPPVDALARRLLASERRVADQLRPQAHATTLGLDHSLERDYGLDSLARLELIARIERDHGVSLDEATITQAETPRDLLRFILPASRHSVTARRPVVTNATATERSQQADRNDYPPDSVQTLIDVFEWHLQRHPQRVLITLDEDGEQAIELSYADLHRDACAVAAGLRRLGLERASPVAIMLPTGREFFAAFFGVLYAGLVPVPLYPPARPSQLADHLQRITGILHNAQTQLLITVERAKPLAHLLRAQLEGLRSVSTVTDLAVPGAPKGVFLTHVNLLANLRAMWRATKITSSDTFVSWLPLYHDMGLIGACLGGLYIGFHVVLMSPLAFLARPARWLETIQRHRGSVSAAPDFAYELCLSKLSEADLDGLDLSEWRLAFNGAEPVSPQTLERFAQRFARCDFKREALTPVYGLAESSVGLAFPPAGRGPLIDRNERLVVLAETRVREPEKRQQLVQAITALSASLLGAPADDVVLAPPRSVLKTSSGKTRRAACRELYEQGRLGETQRPPWQQWVALTGTAAAARTRRAEHDARRLICGLWAWGVFCTFAALAWIAVMALPGVPLRRRVTRTLTRAAMRLMGLPVQLDGLATLPARRPLIVVSNHASYVDAMVLGAVLPPDFSFAAKRELADVALIGPALRRLGMAFVERADPGQAVEDTRALQSRVGAGESIVFFPGRHAAPRQRPAAVQAGRLCGRRRDRDAGGAGYAERHPFAVVRRRLAGAARADPGNLR